MLKVINICISELMQRPLLFDQKCPLETAVINTVEYCYQRRTGKALLENDIGLYFLTYL